VICAVEELGLGSTKWKMGERVGIGYHGGYNHVTGLTMDGGYAEFMVVYEDSLSSIPNELSALEAVLVKQCLMP